MADEKGYNQPPQYPPQQYPNPQYGFAQQQQPVTGQPMPMQGGTTVVISQQPGVYRRPPGRDWSSGLCACFEDLESCCCVLFFGYCYLCCMYSRYRENCCVPCCTPDAGLILRVHHRARHNIQGSILNDCCMMAFCGWCALCQMKRDMDFVENQEGSL